MKIQETQINCQIPGLQCVPEGTAEVPAESLSKRLKLMVRRRLGPSKERAFKNRTNDLMSRFCKLTSRIQPQMNRKSWNFTYRTMQG